MRLRWAVILIALLPLLLASAAESWVVAQRARVLTDLHVAAIEPVLLAARRTELQRYLNLARSAIAPLVRDGMPDEQAQREALALLQRLEFGHDGTFFVMDFDGQVLLYPRQSHLVGRNLQDLQDRRGDFPVRRLLAQARAGGGYVDIEWVRPSSGQVEAQLGYVEPIAGWHWVLGTGTFVDEPEQARRRMAETTATAVTDTLSRMAVIAVLSTLLVVGAAVMVNLNEQRKADAKLRAMAGQIVTTQEEERARVARELHDGVSQSLVAAKFVVESALGQARRLQPPQPQLETTLTQGVGALREVLGDLRRISHDLRPALLDDLGLSAALEHFGREWSQHAGVVLETHCEEAFDRLPERVVTTLFRLSQEALGNVAAHAGATRARLALRRESDGLCLEIEDDGKGFDAQRMGRSPRSGLGLTHMRERATALGGRFEIISGREGTRVRVLLPEAALS